MTQVTREERLSGALATLAETLTSDYDVVQLLHTVVNECIELVDAQAAGLLLKNGHGDLELVASTSEAASFVEVMQLNGDAGPCVECARTGEQITVSDVEATSDDWVDFREASLAEGFHSSLGVPLRVHSEVIGAMGLYRTSTGDLSPADVAVAQALANLATVGILQERALRERGIIAEQLQRALDSRVLIEQAKGVLAASIDVDMEEAFRVLREHARTKNLNLHEVARGVVDRSMDIPGIAHRAGRGQEQPEEG
ncbi:GAF and ANTAR domain-containing protein [Agrococcus jenensis]|uniref:GAF domain-containing protein n=1 Tax=Agrococcus jenensis TaxID=46353 RepID=A0A3N2AT50_9MICO|nr:GAF and ANTAR domain-containing protein [Agrococcus jenensis]ROR66217.1 GAF domain-containing protein [Agrococcus jenensis]